MAYAAFLDIVGMRNMAKIAVQDQSMPARYYEVLESFHEQIFTLCLKLSKSGQVYFFSDSAYVQDSSLNSVLKFVQELRTELLLRGIFFRAAVMPGSLEARDIQDNPLIPDMTVRSRVRERARGHHFGTVAASLFGRQENLKGIGVDCTECEAPHLTYSCHVPDFASRRAEAYRDIRLTARDMAPKVLHSVLTHFYMAKLTSARLGRYYVPLLVLWINSTDFNELHDVAVSSDEHLVCQLLNGSFERLFGDVTGVEQVYFALLNCVESRPECVPAHLARECWRYLEKHLWILRNIQYAPSEILPIAVRDNALRRYSERVLRASADCRLALTMIRESRAAGMRDKQIAQLLNERGVVCGPITRWHANSVGGLRRRESID